MLRSRRTAPGTFLRLSFQLYPSHTKGTLSSVAMLTMMLPVSIRLFLVMYLPDCNTELDRLSVIRNDDS
jgi:hypothetical protein